MAWLLIFTGLLVSAVGIYNIFIETKNTREQNYKQQRKFRFRTLEKNKQPIIHQKKDFAREDVNVKNNQGIENANNEKDIKNMHYEVDQEIKKEINNNYRNLQDLNLEMEKIIRELFTKIEMVKKGMDKINESKKTSSKFQLIENCNYRKDHDVNKDVYKEETEQKEGFRKVLNESLKDDKDREEEENNIPEKYQKLMGLYKKGMSSEEIAEEADMGIRETQLFLRLYRKEVDDVIG
ncbi:MAG: hypothetical protein ACOC1N_05025 [Bacillota bacterium]